MYAHTALISAMIVCDTTYLPTFSNTRLLSRVARTRFEAGISEISPRLSPCSDTMKYSVSTTMITVAESAVVTPAPKLISPPASCSTFEGFEMYVCALSSQAVMLPPSCSLTCWNHSWWEITSASTGALATASSTCWLIAGIIRKTTPTMTPTNTRNTTSTASPRGRCIRISARTIGSSPSARNSAAPM